MSIARFAWVAIDCPDPLALANFYGGITGWEINHDDIYYEDDGLPGWVELNSTGGAGLSFQRVKNYAAPTWPGYEVPTQQHIDFKIADLDLGEHQVLELGATKPEFQPGGNFRVFLDPVGHPFCLVKTNQDATS
jgi:predicted enzyme related to lactoylglutathione lyase